MIRYAPYIDGTIPAFSSEGGIVVPFQHNLAVGESAAAGMVLLIKNLNSSIVGYVESTDILNNIATFAIGDIVNSLDVGQYYKIQLAYYDTIPTNDKDEKLYSNLTYSSVGITKYIGDVSLEMEINSNGINYKFNCTDETEKIYNYNLIVGENSIKTKGNSIRLDDVSPLEHEIAVGLRSKNLLQYPYKHTTKTENGITFTDNGDGTITANGTATADAIFRTNVFTSKAKQSYFVSGCPQGGSNSTYYLNPRGYDYDIGNGRLIKPNSDFSNDVEIVIKSGTTVSNLVFKPQFEEGTTATAYTPFVDVSGASVQKYGKNLLDYDIFTEKKEGKDEYYAPFVKQEDGSYLAPYKSVRESKYDFVLPDGIYSVSLKLKCNVGCNYRPFVIYEDGTEQMFYAESTGEYVKINGTTNGKAIKQIYFSYGSLITEVQFKDFQIELGTTTTDYEPYIEPTAYTADENGIVKGIIGNGEAMTLIADSGATISAEYLNTKSKITNLEGKISNNQDNIYFSQKLLNGKRYLVNLNLNTINNYSFTKVNNYYIENQNINESIVFINNPQNYEYGEVQLQPSATYTHFRATSNNFDNFTLISNLDNTIEHGKTYYYGFIDNNGNHSESSNLKSITPYFEDMFLQDKNHILRIKFNPKVSSFKHTIQEAKQDTLGGKYPYFFRNGDLKYAEFPISGLISYHMQDSEKFLKDEDIGLDNKNDKIRTTNLVNYNIYSERTYREKVLEWLNNGKPKLFRSPTEGNFVVRLMNVSLSPEDRLGRMLWTFNCTAYECAAADYQTLVDLKIVPNNEV